MLLMALMWRVRAVWTGGNIGTGYTNMYFTEGVSTAQASADAARAFLATAYSSGAVALPAGITISFPAGVDVIDPISGVLVTTLAVTPPANIVGAGVAKYAAPAGACVSWVTSGVVDGHRVKGRTFLVPMDSSNFQTDGTISPSGITDITNAANALIAAAPEFVIWHRPASLAAGGGSAHPVLAFKLQDRVAVLTSRR